MSPTQEATPAPVAGDEPLISYRGVCKSFGTQVICEGLDLDVRRSETLCIIGPSGVGKSVTIKMLIGLLDVDDGAIIFDGECVTDFTRDEEFLPIRRRVAMVFQGAALFDSMNVFENIAYPLSRVLAAKDDTLVSEMWKEMSDAWRSESKQRTAWNEKHFQVVMDFRGPELPSGWTMDGDGIRQGFVADGTPLVARAGESAVQQLLPRGLHTHALSARLPGSLRTPRLQTLGKKYLSVLLAGGEWSGHITIPNNAFLTERVGFLRGADPARWQRFSTFQDRPEAHVRTEIATGNLNPNFPPRTGLARAGSSRLPDEDFGIDKPSWFSITGVVTHDAAEIPKATLECFGTLYGSDVSSQPANGGTPLRSRDDVLSRIAMWFTGAVDRWVAGDSLAGDVLIVNWLLEQKLLPNMLSEDERLAELVAEYRRVGSEISPARTVNSLDESGRESHLCLPSPLDRFARTRNIGRRWEGPIGGPH